MTQATHTRRIAALIVSRNRPDLVRSMVGELRRRVQLACDLYVVECGTDLDKLTEHTSAWYPDPDFRGKCYAHNVALQLARLRGGYDYYWVLMNDLVFGGEGDPLAPLVETLEREERMAILSPTCVDGAYPGSDRHSEGDWRAVTTCDYLGFLYKASALEECGFLNPDFKYCWGAIHELAHELNRCGWFVAYSDRVSYEHLGGSTYGAKGTKTISREDYQRNAKRFAYDYFREHYGDDWDERFSAAAAPFHAEGDTFRKHKRFWSRAFSAEELAARATAPDPARARRRALVPDERPGLVKLHLGCGKDKRAGWINVDTQAELAPDLVAEVERLTGCADASVDVIEACHLFEHLTLDQARRALVEWARVLKPGGELFLELPDLERCIRILGQHSDRFGTDLGMIGIYGWPPDIAAEGVPQLHKWGWTERTLRAELARAGFESVEFGAVTQAWRPAARVGRDLRLCAVRAAPRAQPQRASNGVSAPASRSRALLFAWPDWSSARELEQLLREYGPELAGREDAGLVLRFDRALDGPRDEGLALLARTHAAVLGAETALEVHFIDDELDAGGWSALGASLDAIAELPSTLGAERASTCATLALERVRSAAQWRARHAQPLERRASAGAPTPPDAQLAGLLAQRIGLSGKSVLELSAHGPRAAVLCAGLGAARIVGLDGAAQDLDRLERECSAIDLAAAERCTFLCGDVSEASDRALLEALGPFDLTLLTGLVSAIEPARELLHWAGELTGEALAIDAPRDAVAGLAALLRELGFEAELVPLAADSAASGPQAVLLARRVLASSGRAEG